MYYQLENRGTPQWYTYIINAVFDFFFVLTTWVPSFNAKNHRKWGENGQLQIILQQ